MNLLVSFQVSVLTTRFLIDQPMSDELPDGLVVVTELIRLMVICVACGSMRGKSRKR